MPQVVVSSVTFQGEVYPAHASGGKEIAELCNWIEEADTKLISHVDYVICMYQSK